jgi:hypothetical protein
VTKCSKDLNHPYLYVQMYLIQCHRKFGLENLINDIKWGAHTPGTFSPFFTFRLIGFRFPWFIPYHREQWNNFGHSQKSRSLNQGHCQLFSILFMSQNGLKGNRSIIPFRLFWWKGMKLHGLVVFFIFSQRWQQIIDKN